MDLAESAFLVLRRGDTSQALQLFRQAFEQEKLAAELVVGSAEIEPSRSILYRSAAVLALRMGAMREAERMVALGLAGDPPMPIADELRDLYEEINFSRHLQLRGITLGKQELQISIHGNETSAGVIKTEEFIKRIDVIEKMTYRSVERQLHYPFREKGAVKKQIKVYFAPFISVPRAASFAVTIRIGQPDEQLALFPCSEKVEAVIADIFENIEMLNGSREDELKAKIDNHAYLRNFIALARNLAPDGDRVSLVGLTLIKDEKQQFVQFRRLQKDITLSPTTERKHDDSIELKEIIGQLDYADAPRNKIRLKEKSGRHYNVIVPDGLLRDIVKPFWEDFVKVTGRVIDDTIHLENIEAAEDDSDTEHL